MTLDDLQRLLWEFARHRVVTVAARTGLLTLLAQRPATPAEAAGELGLDPLATAKVVRALAAIGLVRAGGDRFQVVETLAPILAGGADDLTPFITHSHSMYEAWGENLEPWLRGEPWTTRARDPEGVRAFGAAMRAIGSRIAVRANIAPPPEPVMPGAYDFARFAWYQQIGAGGFALGPSRPTEKHFSSWVGVAPHNDISGGKRLRSRTLKTNNRAGQAFRIAAQSAAKSPDSAFGAYYRRMKARLGAKQAIVATAHKIARTFYFVLKHRVPFHDLGGEEYERLANERERKNLQKRAAKLGMVLVPAT